MRVPRNVFWDHLAVQHKISFVRLDSGPEPGKNKNLRGERIATRGEAPLRVAEEGCERAAWTSRRRGLPRCRLPLQGHGLRLLDLHMNQASSWSLRNERGPPPAGRYPKLIASYLSLYLLSCPAHARRVGILMLTTCLPGTHSCVASRTAPAFISFEQAESLRRIVLQKSCCPFTVSHCLGSAPFSTWSQVMRSSAGSKLFCSCRDRNSASPAPPSARLPEAPSPAGSPFSFPPNASPPLSAPPKSGPPLHRILRPPRWPRRPLFDVLDAVSALGNRRAQPKAPTLAPAALDFWSSFHGLLRARLANLNAVSPQIIPRRSP